ncbi:MAG: carbon monoxide dehydrogenase subunit G [Alphaproteobacteria bacterium]|nr:carbon monoxide dehydrogenase subunit G [Alphaproteobacteria bacterium]
MKMKDSQTLQAPREVVWKALNDPAVLKKCIPGCESITQDSPTEMSAKVSIKLGPVKAAFNGAVTLSKLNPPESYEIRGQGQGGLAGFASGGATVKLTALGPRETLMEYDVDAQVGGKLAMLGARLIDSTASALAQKFFDEFASVVSKMPEEGSTKASAAVAKPKAVLKRAIEKPTTKPAKKAVKKTVKKPVKKK